MDTICPAPIKVTVDVPFANAEPAPVVFQFPETVHEPVVSVIVPLAPPIIDTSETDTAEAFAARTPALTTTMEPPAPPRLIVASAATPLPPWTPRRPRAARAVAAPPN